MLADKSLSELIHPEPKFWWIASSSFFCKSLELDEMFVRDKGMIKKGSNQKFVLIIEWQLWESLQDLFLCRASEISRVAKL